MCPLSTHGKTLSSARVFDNRASAFQGEPELHERAIPLQRDELERMARFFELRALKFPKVFTSHHDVAHQARQCPSTRKCLLTAWRVMLVPDVSCAIDMAPSVHKTPIRRKRVVSPRAANIVADFSSPA